MSDDWRWHLARELANEVLFDEGVEAARNACVAGASIASAAITAVAWYDNPMTGIPAMKECMDRLSSLPLEIEAWQLALAPRAHPQTCDPGFTPGFGFVSATQAQAILNAGRRLVADALEELTRSRFLLQHHSELYPISGPLNQAGMAALFFVDHKLAAEEAERCFLVWRVETAIAEAQKTRRKGLGAFPFLSECYAYEGPQPAVRKLDLADLLRRVGLE